VPYGTHPNFCLAKTSFMPESIAGNYGQYIKGIDKLLRKRKMGRFYLRMLAPTDNMAEKTTIQTPKHRDFFSAKNVSRSLQAREGK
jgi:hypothetical protein